MGTQELAALLTGQQPEKNPHGLKMKIYQDKDGEWRWSLRGVNNEILCVSTDGYKQRASLEKALKIILETDLSSLVIEGESLADVIRGFSTPS